MIRHEASPSTTPGRGVLILACLPSVREGLRILLDSEGFRPAHTAGSAAEALRQVLSIRPNVAVVDIRLEDSTAVEFCRAARGLLPSLQFLLLASYEDDLSVREAVLAGASGLVLRQLRRDVLLSAVRRTADGNSLINATVRSQVIHDFSSAAARTVDGKPRPVTSSPVNLAPAERDLLSLLAHGRDDECISQALSIPPGTVPALVRTALTKLGIDPQPRPRNHSQMNNDDAGQEVAGNHRDVPPRGGRAEARPHPALSGPLRNPLPLAASGRTMMPVGFSARTVTEKKQEHRNEK
jgi:two-component system, NarL family, response regulator DevR